MPATLRDGRKRQGYTIPFPEVVHDLNGFWQRALGAIAKTLKAPVVTACGPAGPEHLAFYCPAKDAIYYASAGLEEHRRRIGDFAPILVLAHEWATICKRSLASRPLKTVGSSCNPIAWPVPMPATLGNKDCSTPETSRKRWRVPRTLVTPSDCVDRAWPRSPAPCGSQPCTPLGKCCPLDGSIRSE